MGNHQLRILIKNLLNFMQKQWFHMTESLENLFCQQKKNNSVGGNKRIGQNKSIGGNFRSIQFIICFPFGCPYQNS